MKLADIVPEDRQNPNTSTVLLERMVTLLTPNDKAKFGDDVWAMIQSTYRNGYLGAANVDELIQKSGMWKLVTRAGQITAATIYKDQFGLKGIASCTNGTTRGIRDSKLIGAEDVRMGRSWAEVSGKAERMMVSAKSSPIPAKYVAALTGKNILSYNPDGYHYTRAFKGATLEKIIYGTAELTPELEAQLVAAGIQLHDLPKNFKPT